MSNYNSLKATIDANIKQNGRQEITGQILNSVLNQMVTTLGAGYQFAGVATTATNPGTPDAKVFYIANGKGTYTNFGGLEVTEDDVVVLYWDTAWHKVATGIASNEKLTELESATKDYAGVITQATKIIEPLIVGKEIYYKFSVAYHTIGCIGFFDASDNIIGNWIGNTSSSDPANNYEGTIVVPEGAIYLKAFTGNNTGFTFTIDHLYYTDSFNGQIKNINLELSKSLKATSDNNSNNVAFSVSDETNNYDVRDKNANRLIVNTSETIENADTLRSLVANLILKKGKYIIQCNFTNQKDTDVYTVAFNSPNGAIVPSVIFNIEDGILQSKEINIPSDYYGNVSVYTKANRAGLTVDFILISNEPLLDKIDYTESLSKDYKKTISATEVLGINLMAGKSLYYKFEQPQNIVAALGFFDSSNILIGSYIGQPSSGQPAHLYEGTAIIPDNAVYLKAATTGSGFVLEHLYYSGTNAESIDELEKEVHIIQTPYKNLIPENGITYDPSEVLFTNDDVNIGEEVFYSIRNANDCAGYIALYDANNLRIAWYGIGTVDIPRVVSGSFIIPSNFSKAIVGGQQAPTIFYLRCRVDDDPTNQEIDYINNRLWRNDAWLNNRLANPLHTSREKFNEDNPNTLIADETAMSRSEGISELRIPITIVTNAGTSIVAATASASGPVEHGETSIDIARKPNNGSWSVQRIFGYGETYGQFWNLSMVIDRTGVHGVTGRIYIFSACGKGDGIVGAADITYENANLLYRYSDDDGLTWSEPVSLKSLWTADMYDMVTPAPNTGIQLTDGTLVIPLFNIKNGNITSGILYKKPNNDWAISSSVPTIYASGNECVAVEMKSNTPTLFIRNETEKDYTIKNPDYIQGVGIQIWEYSIANDNWIKINSDFVHSTPCQFSVIKCNINGNTVYLQSGLSGNKRPNRYYPTVWASLDGMTWTRVYRIYNGATAGYSSLGYYNGKLIVSYETNGNFIQFQDITNIKQLILDSVNNYINYDITIQDRMQMLFDKLNGID